MYFSRGIKKFLTKEVFNLINRAVVSQERDSLNLLKRSEYITEMREQGYSRRNAIKTFDQYQKRTLETKDLKPEVIDLLKRRKGYDSKIDPHLISDNEFIKRMEKKGFSKEESNKILEDFKFDRFIGGTRKEIEKRLKREEEARKVQRLTTRTIALKVWIECCRNGLVVYSTRQAPKRVSKSMTELDFKENISEWKEKMLRAIEEKLTPPAVDKCDSIGPGSVRLCRFEMDNIEVREFDDGVKL